MRRSLWLEQLGRVAGDTQRDLALKLVGVAGERAQRRTRSRAIRTPTVRLPRARQTSVFAPVVAGRRAELDAVGEPSQEAVELLALLRVKGGEEVVLRRRDGAVGAA